MTNLAILQLGVYLSEEHGEPAHVLFRGLHAADDLVFLRGAALQETSTEGGLLRRRHRVVHRAQTRPIVTEVGLAYRLSSQKCCLRTTSCQHSMQKQLYSQVMHPFAEALTTGVYSSHFAVYIRCAGKRNLGTPRN